MNDDESIKMNLTSMDVVKLKREQLKQIFPELFAEDRIDFEQFRRILGEWIEPDIERYDLNWSGKANCMKVLQEPSIATLKPERDDSVNFDNTENLFIEGDNLEVLKLLQKAYFGKIRMIYIDPPYNTGKEFIYPDNFQDNLDTYLAYTGQTDGNGKKFSTNTDANGRFHSNWLNMIYPRLYLASNLLSDDGVIFISIDDHEDGNLKYVCDSIFGVENFLAKFTWRTDGNFDNQAKIKRSHEYILCYAKNEENFLHPPIIDPNVPKNSKLFNPEIRNTIVKNGPKNPVSSVTLPKGFPAEFHAGVINKRSDQWPHYDQHAHISDNKLDHSVVVSSGWSSKALLEKFIAGGLQEIEDHRGQKTRFVISKTGSIEAVKTRSNIQSHVISSLSNLGGPQKGNTELEELGIVFDDYPKPTKLLEYLVRMNNGSDFYVLDFFAGSCTTAHAVLNLNNCDFGKRKYIMVQLPEKCSTDTRAYRSGFNTIAEIGKERLRRVSEQLTKTNGRQFESVSNKSLDLGFKVFKLTRSNFKIWNGGIDDTKNLIQQIELHIDNVDPTSTPEDILYELILKAGFKLTTNVEKKTMAGKEVFVVADGALIVCLDREITSALIDALADSGAQQVICLDIGFRGNDQLKANAVEAFKLPIKKEAEAITFYTV